MSIKLSVCIPTYNRAVFIEETLHSVLSQATDDVEIVVSDNASTDDTEKIVRCFQEKFSQITYFKWKENRGPDKNYLKVVELAQGEYCWLMGSDDAVAPEAIARMLREIATKEDIYLCNRTVCNLSLQPLKEQTWLSREKKAQVFQFENEEQFLDYLSSAHSLGALFSYISSVCVKRSAWNLVHFNNTYIGTAYSHAYILLSIIINQGTLKYIKDSLVLCRGENDSFAVQGDVKRLLLDLDGYLKLSKLIADPTLRIKFISVMKKEHSWQRLIKIRSLSSDIQWLTVKHKLRLFHFPKWEIALAELGRIKFLIQWALVVKHSKTIKFFVAQNFSAMKRIQNALKNLNSKNEKK